MKQNVIQFSGQKCVGEIKNIVFFFLQTSLVLWFVSIEYVPKSASVLTRLKNTNTSNTMIFILNDSN